MAKRKSSDGALGLVVVIFGIIVFAAYVAFGLLGPVAVLVWWLFAEWRALKVRHILSVAELGPTHEELDQLSVHRAAIDSNQTIFFEIQSSGDAAGLLRRVDGRFDERSLRGRQLNRATDNASEEIENHRVLLSQLEATIENRIDDWSGRVAAKQATRVGVAAWLATMGLIWTTRPEWAHSIGSIVTTLPDNRVLFGASVVSTGTSLLLILVVRALCRRSLTANSTMSGVERLPAH